MIELLAVAALVPSGLAGSDDSLYRQESLTAFVAIENTRVIDGIDYGDGDGVISGGLLYGHPSGFFAGTEFLAFRGNGTSLPRETALGLQTFIGYARVIGEHRVALELLDYRLDAGLPRHLGHNGIDLRYRRGGLQFELAHERDRPYFHPYRQAFFEYDQDRLAVGWDQPFGEAAGWSVGVGASRVDIVDLEYGFVRGALRWRTGTVEWQAGFSWVSDDLDFYGGHLDRSGLLLRVTLPFRLR